MTGNEAFKCPSSSSTTPEKAETPELILESPNSECSSLVSISSVVKDEFKEHPLYNWDSVLKFLLERENKKDMQ